MASAGGADDLFVKYKQAPHVKEIIMAITITKQLARKRRAAAGKMLAPKILAKSRNLHVSVSSGVAAYTTQEMSTLEQLRIEKTRILSSKENSMDFLKSIGLMDEAGKIDDSFCLSA